MHEKETAQRIYNAAKERGENAGLTTQDKKKETSFNTKVNIPEGENAFFWLTYDQQLERSKSKYHYKTHLNTFHKNDEIIRIFALNRAYVFEESATDW